MLPAPAIPGCGMPTPHRSHLSVVSQGLQEVCLQAGAGACVAGCREGRGWPGLLEPGTWGLLWPEPALPCPLLPSHSPRFLGSHHTPREIGVTCQCPHSNLCLGDTRQGLGSKCPGEGRPWGLLLFPERCCWQLWYLGFALDGVVWGWGAAPPSSWLTKFPLPRPP